jgi:leucyl aminopeptidase
LLAAIELNLPLEIEVYLPIAENSISGNAYKVSDVITYQNGKSVEIVNTDAEGRLVLADALIVASATPCDLMIDIATLTGACMVALGTDIYGVLSSDEKLARGYCDFVNDNSSETAWPLPLFSKYKDQLKSKIADMKNSGKRWGGAITAALFLQEFIPAKTNWMHLDIAGPSYDEGLNLFDSMATGIPMESLVLYLEKLSQE